MPADMSWWSITTAIGIQPQNKRLYRERADIFRVLGKIDLAEADEQTARGIN